MALQSTILDAALRWAAKHFGALQVCWLCLAATFAGGWLVTARYAPASELREVRAQVIDLRASSYQAQLIDLRVRQCAAAAGAKQWFAARIAELDKRYTELTGKTFPMPQCVDL